MSQLEQIYELIQNDDYSGAMQLLRPFLDENPNNADGWWLMANAVEDPTDARKALINVLKADPSHVRALETLNTLNDQFPPNDDELLMLIELDDIMSKAPVQDVEEPLSEEELFSLFDEDNDIDLSDFDTDIEDFADLEKDDPLAALSDSAEEPDGKKGNRAKKDKPKRSILRPLVFVAVAALIATAMFFISSESDDEGTTPDPDTGATDLVELVALDAGNDDVLTAISNVQQSVTSATGTDSIVFVSENEGNQALFVQACVCLRPDCTDGPPSSDLSRIIDDTFVTLAAQLQAPELSDIAEAGVNIVSCTQSDTLYRAVVNVEDANTFSENRDLDAYRATWSVITN